MSFKRDSTVHADYINPAASTAQPGAAMRQWQQEGHHEPEELQDQDNQPLHPVVGDVTQRLPECELEERRERERELKGVIHYRLEAPPSLA